MRLSDKILEEIEKVSELRRSMARGRKRKSIKMKQRKNQVKKKARIRARRDSVRKSRSS